MAALAHRTRPGLAGPERRARKRIGSAKAAAAQDRLIALVERGIAAVVVDALLGIGRAPACAGPRRLAPLRARPALGVSVGEQQSHYCDTEQNKTDRAHGSSPSPSFRAANAKGEAAAQPSKPMNSRRCISMTPSPRTMPSIAGQRRASQQKRAHSCPLWVKAEKLDLSIRCPLCPRKRTLSDTTSMSALCRKQTFAVQQSMAVSIRYSITSSASC